MAAWENEATGGRAVRSDVQVGYMNVHHQRVLARAGVRGDQNFGFVMWCSRCHQSYVALGDEVRQRRCPYHDHGAPALAADSHAVEWLM
jgi:hypothetical protein